MAEPAAFSLASNILSKIASPAFDKAYEKGISIWEAKKELSKLKVTIETIQAVLLDAEKKQESSAAVKSWIQRLKAVLYDADDLFDEVTTDDLLKQQMRKGNYKLSLKKKVLVSCFNLNPIVTRGSIAKKVKAVRKSLLDISSDMAGFGFVPRGKDEEVPCNGGLRRGQDPGCFVDADDIIGRDEDRKAILNMLFDESYDARSDVPIAVIAIVGIGGMGKTALAQLVYNDDEVIGKFEQRWFACISDISDEKQVIGKIFQSICEGKHYTSFTLGHLQRTIRESIEGKKFMLVLDDVWDEDHDRWLRRLKLLSGGARGSRIIVTTRSYSAAAALIASVTHSLHGLSDDDSWRLFTRVAFASGDENDTRRIDLGREIVKKCRNVPLAIRSIGSLLYEKNTIQEWESIRGEELPRLGICHEDGIMPVLKLSYDHLPPILKQCFAYCSLFPKDYRMFKRWLIYLWIAQGYIKENDEALGHSYFMYLLRRGFFQETVDDSYGEIQSCKIHDLIHDLAQHVAGDETIMLTTTTSAITTSNRVRHVCNGDVKIEESWVIPEWLLNVKGLRSFMLLNGTIGNPSLLDQTFARFSRLRALVLRHLGIGNVPSSIGELKHLRYLNLSWNNFERLPDSLTNLLNLVTLNIIGCNQLTALPEDIIKLINLRCLLNKECKSLKHLPSGIGEMSCLQYLSSFKVGKGAISEGVAKKAGLDELARLQHQLKGGMFIKFEDGMDEEEIREGDECKWQMPLSLRGLFINGYPGRGIADWDMACTNTNNNLAVLRLWNCKTLKYLPPLRHLPNLKDLILKGLAELEYVEEEGTNDPSSSLFFLELSLKKLKLDDLPKVKGWWRRKVASTLPPPQFPLLSELWLEACPELELKSFPLCPRLRKVDLIRVDGNEVIQEQWPLTIFGRSSSNLVSSIEKIKIEDCKWLGGFHGGGLESLRCLDIIKCSSLQSVHLASPHLQTTVIKDCDELVSFELQAEAPTTSLQKLEIVFNKQLKNLHIPSTHLNALEELHIVRCNVDWDSLDKSRECRLDWDSLTSLRVLRLVPLPTPERIPDRLRQRHALGQLKIMDENLAPISFDALRLGSELSSEQQQ